MKEFIEKLIGRLEELKESGNPYDSYWDEAMYRATELVNSTSNKTIDGVIDIVNQLAEEYDMGNVSDGYHTFNELYHHRAVLFATICNSHKDLAWKSKLHDTGDMYDGMFIVGIKTPEGQATYHYDINPYWDMFKVKELPKAPKWDGHTPDEAIRRIGLLAEEYNNDFCEWRLCDEEANVYDTTCRNLHILIEGSPTDNNYEFCPYCGKKIKIAPYQPKGE